MKMNTKSKLISSLLVLVLCVTAFAGSTYAWFTDEVTSAGNIIKAGNLKIDLQHKVNGSWISLADSTENHKLFDYELWEPGYTQVETMKIVNKGNLAFKYQMNVKLNESEVVKGLNGEKLSDVIDVYMCFGDSTATSIDDITAVGGSWWKMGTLSEMIASTDGITQGKMLPVGSSYSGGLLGTNGVMIGEATASIALHMQESAGNEYQNLTLGNVTVELVAAQWTYEDDSFNDQYDVDAPYPDGEESNIPVASVKIFSGNDLTVPVTGLDNKDEVTLDVGYQFNTTENYASGQNSPYRYWHADFVVSADNDVAADSMALAGYYSLYCDNVTDGDWVALTSDTDIEKDTELRLIKLMGNGSISVNYEELCNYGYDGKGFQCGAVDLTGENTGTTITVELRLYETYSEEEALEKFGEKSTNYEKGDDKYVVVASYDYTF